MAGSPLCLQITYTSAIATVFLSIVCISCNPQTSDNTSGTDAGLEVDGDLPPDSGTEDPIDPHTDKDGDGWTPAQGDCDDNDPTVYPGAPIICNDGKDNNCNGYIDDAEPDMDGDGYPPCRDGMVYDCDDTDPNIHPGMPEIPGDGIDNNCNGITDGDFDGDGWTVENGDCDDFDPLVYPGAPVVCNDGKDNNCNGYIDDAEPDMDGDGYPPCRDGMVYDCDDTDPNIHPGMPEIPGDGIDNNCSGLTDEDIDGDGWTVANGDCNDFDPNIHPGAVQICGTGIDYNCTGSTEDCIDPCEMAAFTSSYLGCEFYASDLPQWNLSKDFAIVVSNPSDTQTANISISISSGIVDSASIGPKSLHVYSVEGDTARTQNVGTGGIHNNAYRIESDLPVAAYQFNSLTTVSAASTDAAMLFATHSLGTRYYSMDYDGFTADNAFVAVYATQPNTQVTLHPPPGIAVTGPTSGTLNPYDILVAFATNAGQSLTGTRVESNKPVGVFGGNRCTQVPYGMSYCDHLEQQIFPRQAIGNHYVVSKSHARQACDPPDRLRVMADTDNTTVTFNPPVAGPWTLNGGEWQETALSQDVEIIADGPIMIGQFLRSSNAGECNDEGDPAFMLQVPIEQFRQDYVFLSPDTYVSDFVDIIAPLGANVILDGIPITLSTVEIGASGHSATSLSLNAGVHTIDSDQRVGVMVYGYGGPPGGSPSTQNVSYGYPAGLDLTIINPVE